VLQRLIRLAALRPELLAEHADAYADMALAEAAVLRTQALLGLAALLAAAVALGLAGAALLLCAAVPLAAMPQPGLLLAVPLLPTLLAAVCAFAARRGGAPFVGLQRQWRADVQLFREATAA
jgi:glyoxylate carboligase